MHLDCGCEYCIATLSRQASSGPGFEPPVDLRKSMHFGAIMKPEAWHAGKKTRVSRGETRHVTGCLNAKDRGLK